MADEALQKSTSGNGLKNLNKKMETFKVLVLFSFWLCVCHAATGPTHGKVVVCYVGTWAVYRPGSGLFDVEHIDPTLCTHLIYSFAGLNIETDSIKSLDPYQDLTENYGKGGFNRFVRLKDRYPHLKVSIAIGGWTQGSTNYSIMASDPQRRSRFVRSVLEFIKKHNFDGLDLDWEFPGKRGGAPHDKANFLLLVKELRAAFTKNNYLLTAALGAGKDTIDIAYDVAGLSVYLDFIHMMCYDYHGDWDKKTGPNAPLKGQDALTVEYTINYMLQLGAEPSKLVMGLPLYGRTFTTKEENVFTKEKPRLGVESEAAGFPGPFTRENGFMGYNEICLELKNNSDFWTIHWDDVSRTPFAIGGDKVIVYDNPRSISEKVKFAMEKNLGGCMVWSMDTDDFRGDCSSMEGEMFENYPLLRTINKVIEISLEDIKRSKENEIPDDRKEKSSSSRTLGASLLTVGLTIINAVIFNKFMF
nr:probable chitinase 2 isoform X1 [Onthophagus taurus]